MNVELQSPAEIFQWNTLLDKPTNVSIFGRTGSGKSYLMKSIIDYSIEYAQTHLDTDHFFDYIIYFTGMEDIATSNGFDATIWPNHIFHISGNKNQSSFVGAVLQRFTTWFKSIREENINVRIALIFDDIGDVLKSKMDNLTNITRHLNVWNFFLPHKYTHLDTTVRDSLHYEIFTSITGDALLKDLEGRFQEIIVDKNSYLIRDRFNRRIHFANREWHENKIISALFHQHSSDRDLYMNIFKNPTECFNPKVEKEYYKYITRYCTLLTEA